MTFLPSSGRRLTAAFAIAMLTALIAAFLASDIIKGSKPLVIAHRGASQAAPENTAYAFEAAIEMDADGIELDVQLTSDGVPVVFHDLNLKRITGLDKKVSEVSLKQIRTLDAGSWFSTVYRNAGILTLEEALILIGGRCFLNIELKSDGAEEQTAALIEKYSMKKKCAVTSFSYERLEKIKEIDPDIRTGLILSRVTGSLSGYEAADAFSIKSMFITADITAAVHKSGKKVYAWTVNNAPEIRRLIAIGADHIITDKPELVKALIDET